MFIDFKILKPRVKLEKDWRILTKIPRLQRSLEIFTLKITLGKMSFTISRLYFEMCLLKHQLAEKKIHLQNPVCTHSPGKTNMALVKSTYTVVNGATPKRWRFVKGHDKSRLMGVAPSIFQVE